MSQGHTMQSDGRGKPLGTLNCKVILLNSVKLSDLPSERPLALSLKDTRGVLYVRPNPIILHYVNHKLTETQMVVM